MNWEEQWRIFLEEQDHDWETQELKEFKDKIYREKPEIWGYYVRPAYNRLVDFFGVLSEELQHAFVQDWEKDYILENLRSHDAEQLFRALQRDKEFGHLIVGYKTGSTGGKDVLEVEIAEVEGQTKDETIEYLKSLPSFKHLLELFGYTLTSISKDDGLQLEPNFPEEATAYIYRVCKGKVYHLTDVDTASLILRNGLKCRVGKRDPKTGKHVPYREYPARIYVYATEPKKGYLIREELRQLARQVCKPGEIVALQADVYNYNVDFYEDPAMRGERFFTYTDIPANLIKVYDRFTLES